MEIPTHESPYDDDLAVAVRAAGRAADVLRDYGESPENVRRKETNDFVTEADERAQAAALELLQEAVPRDAVLAEEGEGPETISQVVDGRRWIVDPLDGTTNYMHGVPPYAVSIALQQDDGLRVGVVLDVFHDELFTAVAGHGLQVNGEPTGVSQTADVGESLLATGFPYRRFEHTEQYLSVLSGILREARGVRRHGSAAVDLAWLACGRFDGFFETGLSPWDVAAGILLVREGGGRVTDYQNEAGLAPLFDQQVCATNDHIHQALLGHVAAMADVRL